jgi:small subunit ribosomal protein S10
MNPRVRIKLTSYDHQLLSKSIERIIKAVKPTNAVVKGPMPLPTKIKKYIVLRSPHVYKKSREQFGQTMHRRLLDITSSNPATVDALMKLELPAGILIDIKV